MAYNTDTDDDDEMRRKTDYGMLVILANKGSVSAKMLLEIIDQELDSQKEMLAAEYRKITPPKEQSFGEMMAYIDNYLNVSAFKAQLAQQLLAEAPILKKEVEHQREIEIEKGDEKEHSNKRKREEEDKEEKEEEEEDEKKEEIPEKKVFSPQYEENENPSYEEKVELLTEAQPKFETLLEASSPVASALMQEIEKADTKGITKGSTFQAGEFLISVITSLTTGSSSRQNRDILTAATYIDLKCREFLTNYQKRNLSKLLENYILGHHLVEVPIIEKVNIKNCSEILEKFNNRFEDSKNDKDKETYNFENFSLNGQYCWFILGYSQELKNSVNSQTQNKGYNMRKEILQYGLNTESTEESEKEISYLQSVLNTQSRLKMLDSTPIQELSESEHAFLDTSYPGLREHRLDLETLEDESNLSELFKLKSPTDLGSISFEETEISDISPYIEL